VKPVNLQSILSSHAAMRNAFAGFFKPRSMKIKFLMYFIFLHFLAFGQGTVTSVNVDIDAGSSSIMEATGGPITTSGIITLGLKQGDPHEFLAVPLGSIPEVPVFRVIVADDLPEASLSQKGIVNISSQTFGGNKTFNDKLFVSSGSVSAPGFGFSVAATTGLSYASGGGVERITGSFSGTERFKFTSEGKLVLSQAPETSAKLNINIYHDASLDAGSPQDGGVAISTWGDNTAKKTATFTGRTAAGTYASPAATIKDQAMAEFTGKGFDGSDFNTTNRGVFGVYAAETNSTTGQGAYLGLKTTRIGNTTDHVSMIIDHAGNAGLTYNATELTPVFPPSFEMNDDSRFFFVEGNHNTDADAGVFIQNLNGNRGLNIWMDNSADAVYLDNIRNNNTSSLNMRFKTATTPVPVFTANAHGVSIGGGTPASGLLFSVGASNDFSMGSGGKIIRYQNSTIADGEILIGNTSAGTLDKATLTAGSGVSITNGAGTVTINAVPGATMGASFNTGIAAGITAYAPILSTSSFQPTEADRQMIMPYGGTLKNLYFATSTMQPSSGNMVITIRKNGADTGLTYTLASGATAGTYSNTTNTVTFAAGDLISLQVVNNSAIESAKIISWAVQITQ
jgi:hypothetical protein